MSDAVAISLITGFFTSATSIMVIVLTKKLNAKVDNYHKEVNGKMSQALDDREALGNERGHSEEKAESK